jgi:hypothetical protein
LSKSETRLSGILADLPAIDDGSILTDTLPLMNCANRHLAS